MMNKQDLIKAIGGMTVLELSQLVKALEEEFGVSAAMPVAMGAVAAAPAGEAAEAPVEKTEFKVTIKTSGDQKIAVIKALRTVTTLGLKEAKDMVDGAPSVVAEAAPKEEAQKMKAALEAAGATVELS